jgi:hypothetical protein
MKVKHTINSQKSFAPAPKYGKEPLLEKLRRRINSFIVGKIANTPFQFRLYRSYWHRKFSDQKSNSVPETKRTHFLTQKPNYGAGIGHQLANWNSGLYFANFFNVKFAHSPFSTDKWENFLGFGEGETFASDMVKNRKFKIVRLPRFNSLNSIEINLITDIINSYSRPYVLFMLEMDQGYTAQCDTYQILSDKFFRAKARSEDKLIYSPNKFNVAVHIRRRMKVETDEVWKLRGSDNEYYANILNKVLIATSASKNVEIYLFSQGNTSDFPEFERFVNIHYCLDMGPVESFLHMINADLLISSKSSFSYKPALISKGIQICPATFWHQYPKDYNYILADNEGVLDQDQLLSQLESSTKLSSVIS